jgi:hypothetical protein
MTTHPGLDFRGKTLGPTIQGHVIGLHAAIRQHELEVPEADGKLQIPANGPQDDVGREAEATKWPVRRHPGLPRRDAQSLPARGVQFNATEPNARQRADNIPVDGPVPWRYRRAHHPPVTARIASLIFALA